MFTCLILFRYKDGTEYMGEHKDDEKDLDAHAPIASLSLGQPRDFYFKHQDCRGKQGGNPKVTSNTRNKIKAERCKDSKNVATKTETKTENTAINSSLMKDEQARKSDQMVSGRTSRNIDKINLVLESGSVLMMNHPTNKHWYHSLPKRMRVTGTRINLTFRCMKKKINAHL